MTEMEERLQYLSNTLMVAVIAKIDSINGNGTVNLTINELQKFNSDTYFPSRGKLTNVPVSKFKFGVFSVDTPIKAGDNVVVLFCDGNIITQQFQQIDDRRHTANNAIVIMGLESTNNSKPFEDFYAIRHNDKPIIKITADGSEVIIDAKLTVNNAVDFKETLNVTGATTMTTTTATTVSSGTISVATSMTVNNQEMNNHRHGGVQPGTGFTGVPQP